MRHFLFQAEPAHAKLITPLDNLEKGWLKVIFEMDCLLIIKIQDAPKKVTTSLLPDYKSRMLGSELMVLVLEKFLLEPSLSNQKPTTTVNVSYPDPLVLHAKPNPRTPLFSIRSGDSELSPSLTLLSYIVEKV
ncbi:hypothetical protein Salat_2120500 [Sesamum alatum]|uniref:Uncharacterized protein n=1 Tax=Sesamum alatum TaxID=300844 RepID=A0AAE2CGZ1_9LAMI|nr:hypothetical protein Salat_2120500 [Sesamum alatum]